MAPDNNEPRSPSADASGQSLIESCLVLALLCLIFFGCFQVCILFAARQVVDHAAARGARARTVGFNDWMVRKVVRVAAIPNAGRLIEPAYENVNAALRRQVAQETPGAVWDFALRATPSSTQAEIEAARIPEYLDSPNAGRARFILDYKRWDDLAVDFSGGGAAVEIDVRQPYPLTFPMHRTFYAADTVDLAGENRLENHYPLYLDF